MSNLNIYEEYVSRGGPGTLATSVIDTTFMRSLIVEARWSLSAAPSAMVFSANGTNDSGITPDVWLVTSGGSQPNLTPAIPPGTDINGTLQQDGRGLIVLKDMPRFVQIGAYSAGSFTGTISLRAFAWSK